MILMVSHTTLLRHIIGKNLTINKNEFELCMQKQKDMSKQAQVFIDFHDTKLDVVAETEFVDMIACLERLRSHTYLKVRTIEKLVPNEQAILILNKTTFYAESGGQIGDKGEIILTDSAIFNVTNTLKQHKAILHYGYIAKGTLL